MSRRFPSLLMAIVAALAGSSVALAQSSLAINDPVVQPEGNLSNSVAIFTVTRSNPGVASSVQFATRSRATAATAGNACGPWVDFIALSGSLNFAADETTKTIMVAVCPDRIDEPEESFVVVFSSPIGATISDGQGVARIVDDDPPPTMQAYCRSVEESHVLTRNAEVVVGLVPPSGFPIRVDYETPEIARSVAARVKMGLSCGQETDFISTAGRLEIPANTPTSVSITVPICGDNRWEDGESFKVTLSNPVNAVLAPQQAQCTIVNDDLPEVSIRNTTVTEPAGFALAAQVEAVVALSIRGYFEHYPKMIAFTTSDGTAVQSGTKTCAPSGDYVHRSGVINLNEYHADHTFRDYTVSSIRVPVCPDVARECPETFQVRISNPGGGLNLINTTATVTILDRK